MSVEEIAKNFSDFMIAGKVNAALRLLSETDFPEKLPTNNETIDLPKKKHPDNPMKFEELLLHGLGEFF